MPKFQRPDGNHLLGLLSLITIYLFQIVIRGNRLDSLELAFFSSAFVLMVAAAFVRGLLDSLYYPLCGGALIAVFSLLRFQQTRNTWILIGVGVGVLFGIYGIVDPLNNSTKSSE